MENPIKMDYLGVFLYFWKHPTGQKEGVFSVGKKREVSMFRSPESIDLFFEFRVVS